MLEVAGSDLPSQPGLLTYINLLEVILLPASYN